MLRDLGRCDGGAAQVKLEIREWSACEREVLRDQPTETHTVVAALKSVKVDPATTVR